MFHWELVRTEESGCMVKGCQWGGVAGWQLMEAQPLAMSLGHCLMLPALNHQASLCLSM